MRIFYVEATMFKLGYHNQVIRERFLDYLSEHDGDILAVSGVKEEHTVYIEKFQKETKGMDLAYFIHSGHYCVNEMDFILTNHDLQINQKKIHPFQGCVSIIQLQKNEAVKIENLIFDILSDQKFSSYYQSEELLSEDEILDSLLKVTKRSMTRYN